MSDLMGKRLASLSQLLDTADAELTALEKRELSKKKELSGCQVAPLLSERPEGSPPSSTKQLNNSTSDSASGATQQPNNSTTQRLKHLNFTRSRIKRLREFQTKVNKAWSNPIVKRMLK
jgi:hypothetical protein